MDSLGRVADCLPRDGRGVHKPVSMAGTACLATAEELTRLTRNPLETLCARFAVDHGLSGKPKGTLVQRLVALKQVTVAHVAEVSVAAQAAVRSPAAAPRPRKQSSTQAATETKRRKLEEYIAREQGSSELRCEGCGYPLVHIWSFGDCRGATQMHAGQRNWLYNEPRVSCNRRSFGCNQKAKLSDVCLRLEPYP